jgi:hypothetical protein
MYGSGEGLIGLRDSQTMIGASGSVFKPQGVMRLGREI